MASNDSSSGEALHRLLMAFLRCELDAPTFCARFETTYNLETNRDALTPNERTAFGQLFDEVVYYSPFAEERAAIPNYRSEAQIKKAAQRTATMLR